MVVPILKGGLGNQMFQVANAFAFAKRHGLEFGLNYNLSFCPNQGNTAIKYKDTIYKKISSTEYCPTKVYREPKFSYVPIPHVYDDILLDGCFQSEKYFKDYENEIKELFEFPNDVIQKVDTFLSRFNTIIVGIHIRRGDYTKSKFIDFHGIQNAQYYIKASKLVQDHLALICTDDWNSVQKEMRFSKAIHSPFTDEIEDLYLLSQCDSLIICNSSFSWWGAFLGKHKNKVIAPKNWFAQRGEKEHDLFIPEWICI